jgi:hypothetical protein
MMILLLKQNSFRMPLHPIRRIAFAEGAKIAARSAKKMNKCCCSSDNCCGHPDWEVSARHSGGFGKAPICRTEPPHRRTHLDYDFPHDDEN